ncbi:MAG TPA: gamma-glutamylcyclotransferase family protein [Planococcus sp. (in: firmicutes)]|nr:gamma-glutamylcyclotransferase family protein [Planococcus sp. (in: firmicutes)]
MLLFVYGTLKKGGKYHFYLGEAALVAEHAMANGTLYDTGMGYPAMVKSAQGEIQGQVYDIPEELWPAIDDLEGWHTNQAETDLFDKQTTEVFANGEVMKTIVYVANAKLPLKEKVETGVWDVRVTQEQA